MEKEHNRVSEDSANAGAEFTPESESGDATASPSSSVVVIPSTKDEDIQLISNTKQKHRRPHSPRMRVSFSVDFDNNNTTDVHNSISTDSISGNNSSISTSPTGKRNSRVIQVTDLEKPAESYIPSKSITKKRKMREKLERYERVNTWVCLFLVGFIGGAVGFSMDFLIAWSFKAHNWFTTLSPSYWGQFALWVSFTVILAELSMLLTYFIAPGAAGSGIPPIKALINGAPLSEALNLRTLFVKIVGLSTLLGGGMVVGKVGPMIHIGACIANNLLRIPIFRRLNENQFLRTQIIGAGCAIGIASNFGAPAGGVLFAVEVMGTYYNVRSYLKAFFAAIIAAVTTRTLSSLTSGHLYVLPQWEIEIATQLFSMFEILVFVVFGVLMGLFAAFFVAANNRIIMMINTVGKQNPIGRAIIQRLNRNWKIFGLFEYRFFWSHFVFIATGVLTFPHLIGSFIAQHPGMIAEDLFSHKPLPQTNAADWGQRDIFTNLALFILVRYVLSQVTVSLPMPIGIYVPLFTLGAGIGRFAGEMMHAMFPNGLSGHTVYPGGYAVVGAAALTAGVTQAFSTSFIVLELVGFYHLPTLISCLVAIITSNYFTMNIYDDIIKLNKWKSLPELRYDSLKRWVVDIMSTDFRFVTERTKPKAIARLLREDTTTNTFPVVESKGRMFLIGYVTRKSLEQALDEYLASCGITVDELLRDSSNAAHGVKIILRFKSAPFSLVESTPIVHAHVLFSILNLDRAFVIKKGRLVGYVSREMVATEIESTETTRARVTRFLKKYCKCLDFSNPFSYDTQTDEKSGHPEDDDDEEEEELKLAKNRNFISRSKSMELLDETMEVMEEDDQGGNNDDDDDDDGFTFGGETATRFNSTYDDGIVKTSESMTSINSLSSSSSSASPSLSSHHNGSVGGGDHDNETTTHLDQQQQQQTGQQQLLQ